MVGTDLVTKILREKCVSGDAQRMIGNVEDLVEHRDTQYTEYLLPEALKPIIEFKSYRVSDSGTLRILLITEGHH